MLNYGTIATLLYKWFLLMNQHKLNNKLNIYIWAADTAAASSSSSSCVEGLLCYFEEAIYSNWM